MSSPIPPPGGMAALFSSRAFQRSWPRWSASGRTPTRRFGWRTVHLGGVDNAGRQQVFIGIGLGIVPKVSVASNTLFRTTDPPYRHCRRFAANGSDRACFRILMPLLSSPLALVFSSAFRHRTRATPPPAQSPLDSRPGGVQGVFHARLLFLHFGFRGCTDVDDRHAPDDLGQALLQLFAS